ELGVLRGRNEDQRAPLVEESKTVALDRSRAAREVSHEHRRAGRRLIVRVVVFLTTRPGLQGEPRARRGDAKPGGDLVEMDLAAGDGLACLARGRSIGHGERGADAPVGGPGGAAEERAD